MKDDPEDVPMAYLLYVILGTLLLVAGAVFFINQNVWCCQSPSIWKAGTASGKIS
jgi:hypothetical protein